jgi:hypothetical protein
MITHEEMELLGFVRKVNPNPLPADCYVQTHFWSQPYAGFSCWERNLGCNETTMIVDIQGGNLSFTDFDTMEKFVDLLTLIRHNERK